MQVDESSQENDYLVEVFTIVEGETVSINIKVIVSTYPTLTVNKTYASDARISGNAYSLYENGSSVGVYISATGETTVSIQKVEYSIFDYQNETTTSLGRYD
jgi:cytoskeletal protein RodZ